MNLPTLAQEKAGNSGMLGKGGRASPRFCFLSAAALFVLAGLLAVATFPCFRTASYSLDGGKPVHCSWPFFVEESPAGYVTWHIPMESPLWKPGALALYGAGHLHAMTVNGHHVAFFPPKVLDGQTPVLVSLGGHLKPGTNDLVLSLEKAPGRAVLRLALVPLDVPYLTLLGVALTACGFALGGFHRLHPRVLPASLAAILLLGIAVRVFYTAGTIYAARSYDTGGHIEYIKYVAAQGVLPSADHGWETHQPPLYYVASAVLTKFLGSENNSNRYAIWQFFSLILGLGTFLLCYPICLRLFGQPQGTSLPHALFLAILAFYPGFVFTSARISNDSLFNFLAFLWFWLVLRAWQQPGLRNWILVSVCLGLGVLTKNTMLPLLVVTLVLIAVNTRMVFWSKAKMVGVVIGGVLFLSGWYQFPRAVSSASADAFIVANHDMGPGLRLPRSLDRMSTFNPAAVVAIPFHNPWNDESRRMYLAEAFFKTSLFGEWIWGRHLLLPARILVVSVMVLMVFAGLGLIDAISARDANVVPVFLTAGAVFGSVVMYFWRLPYACNQDFRFAILLLVPFAFWVANAAARWSAISVAVAIFGINAVLFLAVLVIV